MRAGADSSILGQAGLDTWAPMLEVAGGISAVGTAGEEQTAAGTAGEEQTVTGTAGEEEARTAGEARTGVVVVLVVLAHMPVGSSWAGAGGSCTVAGSCLSPMEEGTGGVTGYSDTAGLACPPTA